jgi:hypothetical protein
VKEANPKRLHTVCMRETMKRSEVARSWRKERDKRAEHRGFRAVKLLCVTPK